jgi:hypothetical protein
MIISFNNFVFCHLLLTSVADLYPGSGAILTHGSGTRDLGWVKSQDPDPGSGMNNLDLISESLETIFWVKILNSLKRIRDGKNSIPG